MKAREVALNILDEILNNDAYINMALKRNIDYTSYDKRDINLITELVYGVVENKIYIDYIIESFASVKMKKISNNILNILRVGVYQILFLDKIPNSAAVNECVKMAGKYSKGKAKGFVNAILRNVVRNQSKDFLIDVKDKTKYLSLRYSYPIWIVEKFINQLGLEETEKIFLSYTKKNKLFIKRNNILIDEESFFEILKNDDISVIKTYDDGFYEVNGTNGIEQTQAYAKGYFHVQDISAFMASKLLDAKKDDFIYDMCAAPGGKSFSIYELSGGNVKIYMSDIYSHKIELMKSGNERLKFENDLTAYIQDASKFNENYNEYFDKVLVDAPCSGFGSIRRKPDIKYKRKKEDIRELSKLQLEILNNASKYVKKDGILLYALCTFTKEESVDVVEGFLNKNDNFILDMIDDGKYKYILPSQFDGDGFFVCRLKKVK